MWQKGQDQEQWLWLKTEMSAGLGRQKGRHCVFGVMLRRGIPGKETLAFVTCCPLCSGDYSQAHLQHYLVVLVILQMVWELVHSMLAFFP